MSDKAEFTVKLTDKVSRPSRKAARSFGVFRKSVKATDKAIGRFTDASGRLREANGRFVQGMGGGGGSSGGAFGVFKGNLLTMAATKVMSIAGAVAHASGELVSFGQNSRFAFGQLAKHGAEPEKLFEHSRALAKRFGLDLMDTTKQYQKFLALQFDPSQADKMIRMGADLRALGNSAEEVKGVFLALGQIKGKGRLQGEEMLQLAERGVSTVLVQEEIGKLLGGKSREQVQKLQQAGKVTADVGLTAIENAIKRKLGESTLGEAGAKYADTTIDGIIGRFKAFSTDAGVTLVDKLTAPFTKFASKGLNAMTGFLASPEGVALVDRMASGLGQAADMIGVIADSFGGSFGETWAVMSESAGEFFGLFTGGDGATTGALLKTLGASLGQLAALSVGFAIGLGVVASAVTVFAGALWQVGVGAVDGLMNTLGSAVGGIVQWWDTLSALWNDKSKGFIHKAWLIGKEIVLGIRRGILEVATLPFKAIADVGTGIADKLRDVLGIHSPSRVTLEMGHNVGLGLAKGSTQRTGMVAAAGAELASSHVDGMANAFKGPTVSSMSAASSSTAPLGSSGFGNISISLHTEVHADSSDADEIGRIAARETRREIEAFFRDLSMEV